MSISKTGSSTVLNSLIPLEERGMIEVRSKSEDFRGVFAVCDIGSGAVIVPDWHGSFYEGVPSWRRFSVAEVQALPEPNRSLVIQYGLDCDFDSIYGPIEPGAVTTLDNYINHSCEPNMGYDTHGNVVTERDVAAGEELTLDYGCFVVNLDEPWECRCGAMSCRKRIRATDWRKLAKTRGRAMPQFLHRLIPEKNRR